MDAGHHAALFAPQLHNETLACWGGPLGGNAAGRAQQLSGYGKHIYAPSKGACKKSGSEYRQRFLKQRTTGSPDDQITAARTQTQAALERVPLSLKVKTT